MVELYKPWRAKQLILVRCYFNRDHDHSAASKIFKNLILENQGNIYGKLACGFWQQNYSQQVQILGNNGEKKPLTENMIQRFNAIFAFCLIFLGAQNSCRAYIEHTTIRARVANKQQLIVETWWFA